jgi:hypothetical protein
VTSEQHQGARRCLLVDRNTEVSPTRQELRQALRQRSEGRLQLDPGEA